MRQLRRYEGRRVLVTGGGSGIGQATVLRILAEGGSVVAADVSETGLRDTLSKAHDAEHRLSTTVVDVGDEDSVRGGTAEAVRHLGGLDTLVNAAGVLRSAHFEETTLFTKISPSLPLADGAMFAGPDSVAAVVAMLGSPDAYFITGTEVRIDGGSHM